MGGRQSTEAAEERPRSNSVDTTTTSGAVHHNGGPNNSTASSSHGNGRSVMSAAEFFQTIRNARLVSSSSESGGSEEEAGPSALYHHPMRMRTSTTGATQPRAGRIRTHFGRRSMPLFTMTEDTPCPICHKMIPSDDDVHLVMCLTRPRITYNDDVLTEEKGECSICLEEMESGHTIARLPCLCIYHKTCIDDWFKRKNCCPEHPGDD